ncbi:unnamed protein product [Prorocentrum cordatum]|uniref:Uncharacterized protein n=1 Tax=Prorocentrum cordatum TaxID=2364126 RepID=A0ABN9UY69_9DINO|nr:unnamed protein product [Polarella glacialis]|mmetsp:Transcript_64465/g.171365  ORF Transcript_64465/g.171365 Transcript_64465/m.171365 type:complete len:137 (-) Transcript_64465:288-698(-)
MGRLVSDDMHTHRLNAPCAPRARLSTRATGTTTMAHGMAEATAVYYVAFVTTQQNAESANIMHTMNYKATDEVNEMLWTTRCDATSRTTMSWRRIAPVRRTCSRLYALILDLLDQPLQQTLHLLDQPLPDRPDRKA